MNSDTLLIEKAKRIIKSEMVLRDLSYHRLSELLATRGYEENAEQLKQKVNRGTFSFLFFLKFMEAIGKKSINLDKYRI